MNELDLTNTQAVIFSVVRESEQTIETPSEDLNPDYGRYIQLAGVNVWGGIE